MEDMVDVESWVLSSLNRRVQPFFRSPPGVDSCVIADVQPTMLHPQVRGQTLLRRTTRTCCRILAAQGWSTTKSLSLAAEPAARTALSSSPRIGVNEMHGYT